MSDAPPLLTAEEIIAINAVRTTLADLEDKVFNASLREQTPRSAFALGKLSEKVNDAREALFQVLVISNAYNIVPVSQAQLHNEKEDTPA